MNRKLQFIVGMSGALTVLGCTKNPEAPSADKAATGGAAAEPITNRIDIPDTVRRNLGITFAKVESRVVSQTLRVPGRFELLPNARREYRTMLAGRVDLLVRQFERVETGRPLYRLDSPPWQELQQKLAEADAEILEAQKRFDVIGPLVEAHEQHHRSIEEQVKVLATQAQRLREGVTRGSVSGNELAAVEASLADANVKHAEVREKETEIAVMKVETAAKLASAKSRFDLLLNSAATLLDLPRRQLLEPDPVNGGTSPLWRTREHVQVVATVPGLVDSISLTNGAWADPTSLVLTTIQPELIRFHAHGLQSELGRLKDGLPARVVPPRGGSLSHEDIIEGTLTLGPSADPDQRTLDLYMSPAKASAWARPGVTAHLEIVAAGTAAPELAVPMSATIRDGLQTILFRRDPANPDKVIRLEADLGINDGHWVVVNSGVKEGDEVVLDGVYPLMLATSGTIQKGGHFHADGTWHEGDN